ncbi:MAG: DUF1971 domain-containing protein [Pseudomonadota bacterium]
MNKSSASWPDPVSLPSDVAPYKQTAQFTEATVPQGLLKEHATKDGVWGVIHVMEGQLRYIVPGRDVDTVLTPTVEGIIMPTEVHRVEPIGEVSFFVEFHR